MTSRPVKRLRAPTLAKWEFSDATQGRLRQINLTTQLPPLALGGVVVVALGSRTWTDALVLSLGLVAALVAFVRWAAGDISRVALPCVLVAAGVWIYGALVAGAGMAFFGLLVAGTLAVPQLSRHRIAGSVALVGFVTVVGAMRLLVSDDDLFSTVFEYAIVPGGLTAVLMGLMFPNKRFYDVVAELEQSREREAELAVMRERMRFASDLHDIQGHTLHVVKLKIALAQKLVHTDAARAQEELREIHALVGDTITQTKELAYAQRRLNLSAELENAKNLFEAAGIRVRVVREAEVDTRAGELLGQVLRETTTNILRHAEATRVEITLAASGITIVNDGARTSPPPELRGLAALEERVAADGGQLTVEQRDGRFVTAATLPQPGVQEVR
ncbi:sensor histidine kinase [Saccharomonospora piscinae]|uniref:sensor histidine kinase n=1 Tax=Saccharomonospora piscinae TaxID=687388 RepID=UPI001106D861|nr:histidine kinase [Saccharomonospora piscinae]TLW90590.1 sensor histidine kinase [Saccharomonospora piscinae]